MESDQCKFDYYITYYFGKMQRLLHIGGIKYVFGLCQQDGVREDCQ